MRGAAGPKGRAARIAVGALAPGPLGVLLLMAATRVLGPNRIRLDELRFVPLAYLAWALFSFLLVGLQSVAYTLLMEYVINRRVESDAAALALSAALGAVAAVPLLFLVKMGWAVGRLLRRMYKRAEKAP